ncbi:MAG: hypothetical protein AAF694_27665 [Bacteroidota bacterium]
MPRNISLTELDEYRSKTLHFQFSKGPLSTVPCEAKADNIVAINRVAEAAIGHGAVGWVAVPTPTAQHTVLTCIWTHWIGQGILGILPIPILAPLISQIPIPPVGWVFLSELFLYQPTSSSLLLSAA